MLYKSNDNHYNGDPAMLHRGVQTVPQKSFSPLRGYFPIKFKLDWRRKGLKVNKLHTLTFCVFHVFCKDHDKGEGLMPKSRFSPPAVFTAKLVFWSNDQKNTWQDWDFMI